MNPKRDVMYQFFLLFTIMMTSVESSIGERSKNSRREAMARLHGQVMNSTAVKSKLTPINENDSIYLSLAFWPFMILSMDEVDQSLTTVGYLQLEWIDEDLTWNSSDFAGIRKVQLQAEDVWTPSIVVSNSAHADYLSIPIETVELDHNGRLTVQSAVILKTTCDLNLSFYPFDFQTCPIVFFPFFEPYDYNLTARDMEHLPNIYNFSGEWSIESREIVLDSYMDGQIPTIMVKMKLKRSRMYYILCILAPMVVTSSMTSLVFWIPPGSGEKMSFLVSVFVSNAVFLNFIAGTMPRNMSDLPRLTLFLVFVVVECFLTMVATVFVMRRYEAEQEEADKESEDAVLEQLENITSPSAAEKEKATDSMPPTVHVSNEEEKDRPTWQPAEPWKERLQSSSFNKLQGLFVTAMSRVKNIKLVRSSRSQPRRRRRSKCRCCIRSSTWDFIFFILFHLISFPFYVLLFDSFMGHDIGELFP